MGNVANISGSILSKLYKMPKPYMIYNEYLDKCFLKGKDIIKIVFKYWAYNLKSFKIRVHLDYPIS